MSRLRTMMHGFGWQLAALTAGGLVLRLVGLWSYLPTRDDYLSVLTAYNYMANGQPNPIMPFHPVLRNVLLWASMQVFGTGAWGAKAVSVVLGVALVALTGLFVRRVSGSPRAALVAAALVAFDILLIDYSRQSIQEVHAAAFAVAGAWLAVESFKAGESRRVVWLLPLSGLLFGLGVASKLYAVMPLGVSVAILGADALRRRSRDRFALLLGSLVIIPATVYLATYAPWFARGYDLAEWVAFQRATLEAMVTHTKPAVGFFANNQPSLWFIRPFYAYADFAPTAAGPQLAVGLGNPVVWLGVLPAALCCALSPTLRRRTWVLQAYFWAAYLPLALSPRPIWMLSAVSVAPFAFALVASAVSYVDRQRFRRLLPLFMTVVLFSSTLLYPLAIGWALEYEYLAPIVRSLRLESVYPGAGG